MSLQLIFISAILTTTLAMANKTVSVLVASNDYPTCGTTKLRDVGFEVRQNQYSGYEDADKEKTLAEIRELIKGVQGIVWATKHPLTKELLDAAGSELKIVSTPSAGYDHIDVTELKKRGIQLSNTPGVLNNAVAEIAVGLIISASRRFTESVQQVKSGDWSIGFQKFLGTDIQGSTVGIIGLGGIGQSIVRHLQGFQVQKFLYTGHREKPEGKELNAHFVTLDTLLAQSDFVVLACPLTDETRNIINATNLHKMKKNPIVVNIGRGGLVDQDALYAALKNGVIYGAGLDVTSPEPLPKDHPLLSLPNLFVLPHIGSATIHTRNEMADLASLNVILAIQGSPILTPVKL